MGTPRYWYNLAADHPELASSYLDSRTGATLDAADLGDIFPPELAQQELDADKVWVPIPEAVRAAYARWRPSPLRRARALEQSLGTRCRIYYKYEGSSPIGSHKANSGVAQAYYAKRAGARRVVAETGAGQWGTAISMGAAFQGLDCEVFMVRNSYDAKPGRRLYMESFGSTVHASPSTLTQVGRDELARSSDSSGSLGLSIAEAVETARTDPRTFYSLGSAFNFVCMHQTVIGLELIDQLAEAEVEPDVLISCIGGGSSFAGLAFPFYGRAGTGRACPEFLAVESNAVPTVTQGKFAFDHGDSAGLTPLSKMYTLGHKFAAPGIHSGGLRYHGLSPLVSAFLHAGHGRAVAIPQLEVFQAALAFTRAEGLIPAPEAAHAIAAAIREAVAHKDEDRSIVFLLTGHGHFDMTSYQLYLEGGMADSTTPTESIQQSLRGSLSGVGEPGVTVGRQQSAAPSAPVGPQPAMATPEQTAGSESFRQWWRNHFAEAPTAARGTADPTPVRRADATVQRPGSPGEIDLTGTPVLTARVVTEQVHGDVEAVRVAANAVITPLAGDEFVRRRITVHRAGR